jgi:hypothetical protein
MIKENLTFIGGDRVIWFFKLRSYYNKGQSFIHNIAQTAYLPVPKKIVVKCRNRTLSMSGREFLKQPCIGEIALINWDKFKETKL